MTETSGTAPDAAQMDTIVGHRIALRVRDLTFDQVMAALNTALLGLDGEAAEEVGCGGDFGGPALATLNAIAEAVGLARFSRGDIDDEDDFFV